MIRRLVPNIPLQALVRGANGVGYTSYPYANAALKHSNSLADYLAVIMRSTTSPGRLLRMV